MVRITYLSEEATILYSNEYLDNVIAEAKRRNIKDEDLVIY